ncbi:MAG: YIP1 family protein [Candidatus Thorarchaeota archaeon]
MRRCEFCDSPVPADATICPICKEEIAEETLERILPMLRRPDAPEVRHMGTFERLWGVIRRPGPTYRDIAQRPDQAGPFMIIIANALIMAGLFIAIASNFIVTVNINGTLTDVSIFATSGGGSFVFAALMSVLPNIMIGMFYLIIGSAFAHIAFKITGGLGSKMQTMSIVGYSMLPLILFRLIALLVVYSSVGVYDVNSESIWADTITIIYGLEIWQTVDLITVASFFWTGFLLIFGIREAHETSTIWAILVSIAVMIVLIWTFWQVH